MTTYDGAEFFRQVRAQTVVPCWGCAMWPLETGRCKSQSAGRVDAHHLVEKTWLRAEFPHGAYDYEDGSALDPIPRLGALAISPAAVRANGVLIVRLETLLMDPRNGILVRRYHHDVVTNPGLHAMPQLEDVPLAARDFAKRVGLEHRLERRYPPAMRDEGVA